MSEAFRWLEQSCGCSYEQKFSKYTGWRSTGDVEYCPEHLARRRYLEALVLNPSQRKRFLRTQPEGVQQYILSRLEALT